MSRELSRLRTRPVGSDYALDYALSSAYEHWPTRTTSRARCAVSQARCYGRTPPDVLERLAVLGVNLRPATRQRRLFHITYRSTLRDYETPTKQAERCKSRLTPNNSLQRNCKSVTRFACAKPAPLFAIR